MSAVNNIFITESNPFLNVKSLEFESNILPHLLFRLDLSKVSKSWHYMFSSEHYLELILINLACGKNNLSLMDRVFLLSSETSLKEKVKIIWKRIKMINPNAKFSNITSEYQNYLKTYANTLYSICRRMEIENTPLPISDIEKIFMLRHWIQNNSLDITELDLSNLNLEFLPDELNLLYNLKHLDISYNRIYEIPNNFFLPNLEKIIIIGLKLRNKSCLFHSIELQVIDQANLSKKRTYAQSFVF